MVVRVAFLAAALIVIPELGWSQIFSAELRSVFSTPHTENVKGSVDVKSAFGLGTALTYGYRDRVLELAFDAIPVKLEGERIEGDLLMMPFIISGYIRFHPFGRRWFPYIGAGLGAVVTSFDNASGVDYKVEIADPIAVQGTLGFQYFVVKNLALNWQFRYLYARADLQLTEAGTDQTEMDEIVLDTFIATFGISKYF